MPIEENNIITGGTSTLQPPGGGPSGTPPPWGTNDPSATTQPGSGTGAPTPMPKQDSASTLVQFGIDIRASRQAMLEARAKLETADTILNGLSAELRAMAANPADRKLRADQLVFFPMLLELIAKAIDLSTPWEIETEESRISRRDETHRTLTQAQWIARRIQQF